MSASSYLSDPLEENAGALVEAYLRQASESSALNALRMLERQLPIDCPDLWLACAQRMLAADVALPAASMLQSALARFPQSLDVRYWLAVALWHADELVSAEALLRGVIAAQLNYTEAARTLANLLRGQGRMEAATAVMETLHGRTSENDIRLECVRFIASCQRQHRAAALIEKDLAAGMRATVSLVVAGNLAQELGRFGAARAHLLEALDGGVDLNAWFVATALAETQRYVDKDHADFALFERLLGTSNLAPAGRAAILFAQAKAHDDVGNYGNAAAFLYAANQLVRTARKWSRNDWHAQVEAIVHQPLHGDLREQRSDWTPVFIVGLPRTGTTLLAERLGRHHQVCNRGELPTLSFVADGLSASGRQNDAEALVEARELYSQHLCQDDVPSRMYIDKNPFNFRHIGLLASLFPQARIIHCVRDLRDTALSLWSRLFANDDCAFTYDLGDIAAFAAGHARLMAHWNRVLPSRILEVKYEELVAHPAAALARVANYLDLIDFDPLAQQPESSPAIASTSRWQARQPIYAHSVQRWRAYSPFVPELETMFGNSDTTGLLGGDN